MKNIIIRKRTIFIFFVLIGLLAYSNSFRVPFHYDDIGFLKEKTYIKSFKLFSEWITADLSNFFRGRAVLLFTFYLNYLINGLDTFGYHFVNLLLHISNSFLYYLLLSRYVDKKESVFSLMAFLSSVIFILHPVNTESVTYISSRSSILSAFFILLSMMLFFNSTEKSFNPVRYMFGIVMFLLGLSAKEATVVIPVLLLIFDLYFVSENIGQLKMRLKYHLPFWMIVLIGSAYYLGYITNPEISERPWMTHIMTEVKVMSLYLKQLTLPVNLNFDHYVKESVSFDFPVMISLFIITSLIVIAVFYRKKARILSFSILWFLTNLIPFLFVRLNDYMAERWVYTASLGFSSGIAQILIFIYRRDRKIAIAVTLIIMTLLGTLTYARNEIYKDPIKLWEDASRKSPEKVRPYTNLCASYLERGDIQKAIQMCDTAIRKGSDHVETYINLSSAYFLKNDFKKSEEILKKIKNLEGTEIYHHNLATIYMADNRFDSALAEYEKVLKIRPHAVTALVSAAECLKRKGKNDIADKYYRQAVKGIPLNSEDYLMLAKSFFYLGDREKGIESLRNALITEPLNVNIRHTIANIYLDKGNYDEAYRHFKIMAKLSPNSVYAYKGMGITMMKKGNREKALQYFNKALDLLPSDSSERKDIEKLIH